MKVLVAMVLIGAAVYYFWPEKQYDPMDRPACDALDNTPTTTENFNDRYDCWHAILSWGIMREKE